MTVYPIITSASARPWSTTATSSSQTKNAKPATAGQKSSASRPGLGRHATDAQLAPVHAMMS